MVEIQCTFVEGLGGRLWTLALGRLRAALQKHPGLATPGKGGEGRGGVWTTSVVILTLENLLYYFCFVVSTSQHFSLNQLIFFFI